MSSALLSSRSPASGELEYGADRAETFKETDIMVSARVVFILDCARNLYKRFYLGKRGLRHNKLLRMQAKSETQQAT